MINFTNFPDWMIGLSCIEQAVEESKTKNVEDFFNEFNTSEIGLFVGSVG